MSDGQLGPLERAPRDNSTESQQSTNAITAKVQSIYKAIAELKLSPERQAIVDNLLQKSWFIETATQQIKELLTLPPKFDGFLQDLANRPEKIANVTVLSLARIAAGNFGAIAVFNVYNETSGKTYTYEYEGSRLGAYTGAKGVAILEDNNGVPVALAFLKGEKFATGRKEYDGVGGFCAPGEAPDETAKKELQEEMGIAPNHVREVIDLGELAVDTGLTNNKPRLFAARVTCPVEPGSKLNLDPYELASEVVVIPIADLPGMIDRGEIQDSFVLACILRLHVRNVIAIRQLPYGAAAAWEY